MNALYNHLNFYNEGLVMKHYKYQNYQRIHSYMELAQLLFIVLSGNQWKRDNAFHKCSPAFWSYLMDNNDNIEFSLVLNTPKLLHIFDVFFSQKLTIHFILEPIL